MEQLLNGALQRSRERTGLNGATDCSVATLSVTFSGSFLWALTYSADVIPYFGNISQDKSASGASAASRAPVGRHNSAGFIRGWKCFRKRHTQHKTVSSTTQSCLLLRKSPQVYINPLKIHCSSALPVCTCYSFVFMYSLTNIGIMPNVANL